MGRPDSPVDYSVPECGELAAFLRTRKATGQMTHQALAQRTGLSAATLKRAASGTGVPKLTTVAAFVQGCGASREEDLPRLLEHAGELWKKARHALLAPRHTYQIPDPQSFRTVAELRKGLRDLYLWAGAPTLRSLEYQAGSHGVLPRSTAHRISQGGALPVDDSQLRSYLTACGLHPDRHDQWTQALEHLRPQPALGREKVAPPFTAGCTPSRGRPWKPVRATTAQAHALADFLRDCVHQAGKPLAALCEDLDYSKTQTAHYLGGAVPPRRFVENLVFATVPPPTRQHRHHQAMRLWSAASTAAAPQLLGTVDIPRARQVQTHKLLNQSMEQQLLLQRTLQDSQKLVLILVAMIGSLSEQIGELGQERERLMARDDSEAWERRLARAQEQHRRAREELARAQDERSRAEALSRKLQEEIDRLTQELSSQANAQRRISTGRLELLGSDRSLSRQHEDHWMDDTDRALARAAEVRMGHEAVLQNAENHIELQNPNHAA